MLNVIFLCTGNSARSILAEAILRQDGAGRFRAFSAGSQPRGAVHPLAFRILERMGYPHGGLSSKSWDAFAGAGAPRMDFVFTVCDNAAGEACPLWLGHPATAHWGIADPAALEGPIDEQERAFLAAFRQLKERILAFLALPIAELEPDMLHARLAAIGRMEGATRR